MRSYRIHLIRHGLTDANKMGKYVGCRSDFPLSAEGSAEIRKLCDNYDYPDIEKLYCSPMLRCRQTADIIYEGFTPYIVDDLTEFDFGQFEGLSIDEIEDKSAFMKWLSGQKCDGIDAEDPQEFSKRCISAFCTIVDDMMSNEITSAAVVAHGGVIATLLAAMGLPRRPITDWIINNGMGYTVLINPTIWMNDQLFEIYDMVPRISPDSPDYELYYGSRNPDDDDSPEDYELEDDEDYLEDDEDEDEDGGDDGDCGCGGHDCHCGK